MTNARYRSELIWAEDRVSNTPDIHRGVADFIREVLAETRPHVEDVTAGFADLAMRVAGVNHVGFMLLSHHGAARPAPAVNGELSGLDVLQAELHEGPALDAALHDRVVRVPDLARADQWPRFTAAATAQLPVCSMVCLQLYTHVQALGAMTLACEQPHGLSGDAEELGAILATHVSLTLDAVQRIRRYRSALGSRDLIGQAKGMITERYDISSDEAFSLLTRIAGKSNKPIVAIAKEIVEGSHDGGVSHHL